MMVAGDIQVFSKLVESIQQWSVTIQIDALQAHKSRGTSKLPTNNVISFYLSVAVYCEKLVVACGFLIHGTFSGSESGYSTSVCETFQFRALQGDAVFRHPEEWNCHAQPTPLDSSSKASVVPMLRQTMWKTSNIEVILTKYGLGRATTEFEYKGKICVTAFWVIWSQINISERVIGPRICVQCEMRFNQSTIIDCFQCATQYNNKNCTFQSG